MRVKALLQRLVICVLLMGGLVACTNASESPAPPTALATPTAAPASPPDPKPVPGVPAAEDAETDEAVPTPAVPSGPAPEPPKAIPDSDGGFYRWVDKEGVTHMVDNWALVPAAYRKQVQTMPREERSPDSGGPSPNEAYEPGRAAHYWSMEREANARRARERRAQQQDENAKRRQEQQRRREEEPRPVLLTPAQIKANYDYWIRARGKKPQ